MYTDIYIYLMFCLFHINFEITLVFGNCFLNIGHVISKAFYILM